MQQLLQVRCVRLHHLFKQGGKSQDSPRDPAPHAMNASFIALVGLSQRSGSKLTKLISLLS
jgi:hypothetical protein